MLPASVFSAMPGINIRVEGTAEDIKPMKVVLGPCSLALALEQPESREDVEAIQKAAAAAAADGGDYFSPLRGSHAAHLVYMPEDAVNGPGAKRPFDETTHQWGTVNVDIKAVPVGDSLKGHADESITKDTMGVPDTLNPFGARHKKLKVVATRFGKCECGRICKWRFRVADDGAVPHCGSVGDPTRKDDEEKPNSDNDDDDYNSDDPITSDEEMPRSARAHIVGGFNDIILLQDHSIYQPEQPPPTE